MFFFKKKLFFFWNKKVFFLNKKLERSKTFDAVDEASAKHKKIIRRGFCVAETNVFAFKLRLLAKALETVKHSDV